MSQRIIYVLIGVFVLLAAVASWPLWGSRFSPKSAAPAAPIVLSGFSADQASLFSLVSGGQKLEFQKVGTDWLLDATTTKATAVQDLFTALGSTSVGSLVAKNPDNYPTLGVTETAGTVLHVEQGSAKLDLVVGYQTGYRTFYLRELSGSGVYQATGDIFEKVHLPKDSWFQNPPPPAKATKTKAPVKKR